MTIYQHSVDLIMKHQNLLWNLMSKPINILQQQLDGAFQPYLTDNNIQQYLERLKIIQEELPELIKKEFSQRQDGRTFLDFAKDMAIHTAKERQVANFWTENFAESWFGTKHYEYTGIDKSGRLICGKLKTRGKFKEPDLRILNNDGEYLELKTCRVSFKATYKEADIRHYAKLGNVNMVTLHSDGNFSPENFAYYSLLFPSGLALLVDKMDSGEIEVKPRKEYGDKQGIKFTQQGIEKHFIIGKI